MIDLNQEKQLVTKQLILNQITDLEIYRKYLGGEDVKIGKVMISPFREETRPSFGFFIGESGEICFKDYLLGAGDCIKFVQMKYGITYFEALSKIAVDFDMSDQFILKSFDKGRFTNTTTDFPTREELLSKVTSLKLGKNRREWAAHDRDFWQGFGISLKTLQKYKVEPVSHVHINGKVFKAEKHAYVFIEYKDGIETYKVYQPYSKNYKWINGHNDSVWQGWEQLPEKGPTLIITKSLKDVMALHDVAGLPAVSLQSENVLPKQHVYQILKDRFEVKYSLYDNDYDKEVNWGKQFGKKISTEFGLVEMYIPEKYESKDFSDLVKNVGTKKAREVIEDLIVPF
jgi:hypothetical protein